MKKKTIKSKDELVDFIKTKTPAFYFSSQTSTVIPYDKIESALKHDDPNFTLVSLSQMPSHMELLGDNLLIKGAVSWKEARAFLKSHKKNIMTAPTEELALISAGAATSCTGERSFCFGNFRSQIEKIKYINHQGDEVELNKNKKLFFDDFDLSPYQNDFSHYKNFKNAPYPRFENEIDLLIGTEGQLGIITEIEIRTCPNESVNHLFILLDKWEENPSVHFDIIKKIQNYREQTIVCELIDSNAFSFLKENERPNQGKDAVFFEVKSESFESFYEDFIMNLPINQEEVFELNENRFHELRASIPRAVFEENSRMGVTKMGTDVQVTIEDFPKLLEIYKEFTQIGVQYNLFGHFGDCHLHFNFMPTSSDTALCQVQFERLYKKVLEWKGSPFAEHGIGTIKQKFIAPFHGEVQRETFHYLKSKFDPDNIFFPQGFLNS